MPRLQSSLSPSLACPPATFSWSLPWWSLSILRARAKTECHTGRWPKAKQTAEVYVCQIWAKRPCSPAEAARQLSWRSIWPHSGDTGTLTLLQEMSADGRERRGCHREGCGRVELHSEPPSLDFYHCRFRYPKMQVSQIDPVLGQAAWRDRSQDL